MSERPEEAQGGYPEEGPEGADPSGDDRPSEDSPPRDAAKAPRKQDDRAGDPDHGKATGNRRSAG